MSQGKSLDEDKATILAGIMPDRDDALSMMLEYEGRQKLKAMQNYDPRRILKKGSFVFVEMKGAEEPKTLREKMMALLDNPPEGIMNIEWRTDGIKECIALLDEHEEPFKGRIALPKDQFRALKDIEVGSRELWEAYENDKLSAMDVCMALGALHEKIQKRLNEKRGTPLLAEALPYLMRRDALKMEADRAFVADEVRWTAPLVAEAGVQKIIAAIDSLKTALVVELRDIKDQIG